MKPFLYITLLFSFVNTICAQEKTKLEIINSNFSYYDANVNPDTRRLVDSVIFKHEGAIMYCDSAWYYFKENRFEAFGNIHINQGDTLHLYGNHLNYIGKENKAIVSGDILLKDQQVELVSDQLFYDLSVKRASYYTGATIINSDNKLESNKGHYLSEEKLMFFKDDVFLENPSYIMYCDTLKYHTLSEIAYFLGPTKIISDSNFIYCEDGWYNTLLDISQFNKNAYLWSKDQRLSGDSLYYDRKRGYGNAINNVSILDTTNDYLLNGEWAEYFEKQDSSIITDQTLLTLFMEDDSLFLHGDTIKGTLDKSENRVLSCFNNVKFFSKDLQGKCLYLNYTMSDSTIRLFEKPILWSSDYQLSGHYINLQLKGNSIDYMHIIDNSFIASEGSSIQFNQIKGREMLGYFRNSQLDKINVYGNGEAVYVLKDELDKITGINTVSCSQMRIDVKDKDIQRISFQNKPDAILYPYDELPKKWRKLDGFMWRFEEKPSKKEDIFLN